MNQPLYPLHQANQAARRPLQRSSQLLPLEQRFMFDGAVAGATAEAAHAAEAAAVVPPAVTVRAADPSKDQGKKEVALVDTSLADYKTLEAGVRDGVGIVEFDGSSGGLAQIAAWAATQSGLDAIHILSHGSGGTLDLGTDRITDAALASAATQADLAELGQALTADGDLLLYGCDVAAGGGAALLAGLARATGADIAASTDTTGASRFGGDWVLESHSGDIDARALALTDYDHLLAPVDFTIGYADGAQSFIKVVDGVNVTFAIIPSITDPGQQGFYTSTFAGTMYVYAPQGQDWSSGFTITVPNGYVFDVTSATGAVAGTVTYHPSSGSDAHHSGVYTDNGAGAPITDTYNLTTLKGMTQLTITSAGDGLQQDGYLFFTSMNISVHALPTTTVSVTTLEHDTGNSGSDFLTATASNTLSGTLSAALTATQKVQVSYDGGTIWDNATSYATGSSNWSTDTTLVVGTHTVQVRVAETFDGGTTYYAATAESKSYTLDTTAPNTSFNAIRFGADSGVSNTDLTTNTGAQDIKATLSAPLAAGEKVWVSTTGVNGSYTDVSSFVTGTTLNWTNQTLSGSDTLAFKVSDAAGNDSTPSTASYVIDTTAPTAYATGVALSNDTGTPGDLITKTAAQIISGTLSANLGANEMVQVSVANGAWTTATIVGSTWSLSGQTLSGASGSIRVKVTDLAYNDSATVYSASYTLDTTGPAITFVNVHLETDSGNSATDFITSEGSQTIHATLVGTLDGSDKVYGSINNGASWADITSKVSGNTLTWNNVALSGNSSIQLKVIDNANNDSTTIYTHTYSIDSVAPAAPATPTLDALSDTGVSSSDKITKDTTPTLTGTAESGSTVTVYDGATVLGTVVATGGSWSYITGTLGAGSHTFKATATDTAGNTSADSTGLTVTIDTTAPVVSSVSVPANGAYAAGSTLTFIVHADDNVYVDVNGGTPSLTITVGGNTRNAAYVSGSGSGNLVFAYTVQAGETDSDGIVINGLATNGATITDAADNAMSTTLHSVGATNDVLVDTTAPAVSSVAVSADGTYYSGEAIEFVVNFGEAVTVDTSGGTPRIAIVVGATTRYANYVGGSGTGALTFAYAVVNGDIDSNGITVGALDLNNGTLKDAAGNNAVLTLNNKASTAAINVDGTSPSITGVGATSADGAYAAGSTITITVDFSTAVTVSGGSPTLTLDNGAVATYTGGDGTSTLTFSYVVAAGQNSADLDYSSTAALSLNGATIVDAGGAHRPATLTLATPGTAGSLGANRDLVIDTTAPSNAADSIVFTPDYGALNNDLVTNDGTLTISGTLVANLAADEHVYISFDNGASWMQATAAAGTKDWTVNKSLSGSDTIKVQVRDDAGNIGTDLVHTYTIDTTAPTITFSHLALSADHGGSNSDFLTDTGAQTVSATLSAAPAAGDVVYGSVDGGATWSDITSKVSGTTLTWTGATLVGSNTLMLKVTDLAGNDSTAVASQSYVIDATPPGTDIASVSFDHDSGSLGSDFITNNPSQTVSGTLTNNLGMGERVLVSLDNGATWSVASAAVNSTSWELTGQTLVSSNTLLVKVSSAAGADGSVTSQAYVYDTAATIPTVAPLTTMSLTPVLTGTATLAAGETMTVTVGGATYDVVPVAGAWSLDLASAVPVSGALSLVLNNQYSVTATVTDLAGNVANDLRSGELIVGNITPAVPAPTTVATGVSLSADSGASDSDYITNVAAQTLSGGLSAPLAAGESVLVSLDGGSSWRTASASGRGWSLGATLSSGGGQILVKVSNEGGDGDAISQSYTLDTTAPFAPTVAAVTTNSATPTLGGSAALADGDTLSVSVGGATYNVVASGGNWSLDLASATPASGVLALVSGRNEVIATITDRAGNTASDSSSGEVQLTAVVPTTTVTIAALSADTGASATDFITSVAAQTVSGSLSAPLAIGQRVEVSLDGGATWNTAAAGVGASTWSAAVTLGGGDVLMARVASDGGNGPAAQHGYTLDTTAPLASPVSGTVSGTGAVSGSLSAALADGEAVLVSRDGGNSWQPASVSGSTFSSSGAPGGAVTVMVRDAAGNVSGTLTIEAAVVPVVPPVQQVPVPTQPPAPGDSAPVAAAPTEAAPVDTGTPGAGTSDSGLPPVLSPTSPSLVNLVPPTSAPALQSPLTPPSINTLTDNSKMLSDFTPSGLPAMPFAGDALAVNTPIPDATFVVGERVSVQIPPDSFTTTSGAGFDLMATSENGAPLPGWLKFDAKSAKFEGTPPPGFEGTLSFKVTARDAQGRVAVQTFKIVVGKEGQGAAQPVKSSSLERHDIEPVGRDGLNQQMQAMRGAGADRLAMLSRSAAAAKAAA